MNECVIEVSEAALYMVIEEYEEADKERLGEIWTILEQVRPSNTSGELHSPGYYTPGRRKIVPRK